MNILKIANRGTDLSSRNLGATLRACLLEQVSSGAVTLDFSGVRSVSHSFSDEFIAVLVENKGETWFKANVTVINHSSAVRTALLDAIQYRLNADLAAA